MIHLPGVLLRAIRYIHHVYAGTSIIRRLASPTVVLAGVPIPDLRIELPGVHCFLTSSQTRRASGPIPVIRTSSGLENPLCSR